MAPHHTSSVAALVGGGSGLARPGAVSRAHRGVLFLDECAEIGVSAMEALRDYAVDLIEQKRLAPDELLMSALISAEEGG